MGRQNLDKHDELNREADRQMKEAEEKLRQAKEERRRALDEAKRKSLDGADAPDTSGKPGSPGLSFAAADVGAQIRQVADVIGGFNVSSLLGFQGGGADERAINACLLYTSDAADE